jgi:hypothetical protein
MTDIQDWIDDMFDDDTEFAQWIMHEKQVYLAHAGREGREGRDRYSLFL